MLESITPDVIVKLRNAVRKELDFGQTEFDTDRKNAFVAIVGCDPDLRIVKNSWNRIVSGNEQSPT